MADEASNHTIPIRNPMDRVQILADLKTQIVAAARSTKMAKNDDAREERINFRASLQTLLLVIQVVPESNASYSDPKIRIQELLTSFDLLGILLLDYHLRLHREQTPPTPKDDLSPEDEEAIADIVWTHWESTGIVVQKLRTVITNLFLCSQSLRPGIPSCRLPAISRLLARLSKSVWNSKRSLSFFLILMTHIEPQDFLDRLGDSFSDSAALLRSLLAPIAQDKIASVTGAVGVQWTAKVEGWADGSSQSSEKLIGSSDWLNASARILLGEDDRARLHICNYYLLPLLKTYPAGYAQLATRLKNTDTIGPSERRLAATVALAQIFAPLQIAQSKGSKLADSAVDPAVLRSCLSHPLVSLRFAGLSILCVSASPSSPVKSIEFQLLKDFLRWNLGETDSEMKQHLGSMMFSMLGRLRDSSYAAGKKLDVLTKSIAKGQEEEDTRKNMTELEEYIREVKEWLVWLTKLCLDNVTAASPYRMQSTALRLLDLLFEAGLDPLYSNAPQTSPTTPGLAKTKSRTPVKHKTQNFPFHIQIITPSSCRSLVRCLLSTFNDVRLTAFEVLRRFPAPLPGFEVEQVLEDELVGPAVRLIGGRRETENSTGSLLLRLVMEKEVLGGRKTVPAGLLSSQGSKGTNPLAAFFDGRLEAVEKCIVAAEQDLMQAAELSPVQGPLMAVSHLISSLSPADLLNLSRNNELVPLLTRSRALVDRVWQFTKIVLCAAAPEGNELKQELPDHEEARALIVAPEDEDELDEEIGGGSAGPKHKVVLSACWRGMKEASDLYMRLVSSPASAGEELLLSCWSIENLDSFGTTFESWLLTIRHHGAFGAIGPSYGGVCSVLAALPPTSEASRLPSKWLHAHITAITSRDILFTRRSAGLPFCILAACRAVSNRGSTLQTAMDQILHIAESDTTPADARIHAMNTLKILHSDGQLSSHVMATFVERSFALAIKEFTSSDWRIRNVAMILFAGLTRRTFGNRPLALNRDHDFLARRETAVDFFRRFPSLHQILLAELRRSVSSGLHQTSNTDLQSPLFSVLLLLSLLQTPTSDEQTLSLAFVNYVQACTSSRVWKIRVISADALTALVGSDEALTRATDALNGGIRTDMNHVDSWALLQAKRMLEVPVSLSADQRNQLSTSLETSSTVFLTLSPLPGAIRAAFLDVCETSRRRFGVSISLPAGISVNPSRNLGNFTSASVYTRLRVAWDESNSAGRTSLASGDSAIILGSLAALEHNVSLGKELDSGVQDEVLRLAKDQSLSIVVRLPTLRLLASCTTILQPSDWTTTEVLSEYQTTKSIPTKEELLPIFAAALRCDPNPKAIIGFLEAVVAVSGDLQSVNTRINAARSLRIFSKCFHNLQPADRKAFLKLTTMLLQDDDEEVREEMCLCCGELFNHGLPVVPTRGIELVLLDFAKLEESWEDMVAHVLTGESTEADFEDLRTESPLLFAVERPNLYRDDLTLLLLTSATVGKNRQQESTLTMFVEFLSRLRSMSVNRDMTVFGATARRSWCVLASKTVVIGDLLGDQLAKEERDFVENLRAQLDMPVVISCP